MAGEMPDRIWDAARVEELSMRLRDRAEVAREEGTMTARRDADRFVEAADAIEELATTHQRTLDALEQVLDDSRHGLTMAPATRALALYTYAQGGGTDPDILAGLDAATAMLTELGHFGSQAALARIKEAT